jgi:hypothetical protein
MSNQLNEEIYYQRFQDFVKEESEEIKNEPKKSKKEKKKINKDSGDEGTSPERESLITDTLTPEEKKKQQRDKDSESRKRSWGAKSDITGKPEGYDDLKSLSRGVVKEKKKKRKPQCVSGNGAHSGKDGRFVDPYKEKGSFSMPKGNKSGTDCDWGKASRRSANRSHSWVKQPCGRDSKYRCRDGSAKWGPDAVNEDRLDDVVELSEIETSVLVEELSRRITEGVQGNTYDILKLCSQINASAKGDFPPNK